ncbi:hypothetical protein [Paenibacillus sp. N3.4]|uniref:hypothetical protein n=1 Tax=Paenibacillus sp. N3.4 TaxID=2603222 RepID=UPI0011C8AC2C|nr:hypothetical protein [Paenibacillus sp. N3.4]TXK75855.1 hypothetical protein FU659_27130 [Paenibacillus sp. N3.4]
MKRPLKVLSTSLGFLLVGQMLISQAFAVEAPSSGTAQAGASKLVEWSSDEVKAYYDPAVDWSLPIPPNNQLSNPTPTPQADSGTTGSGASTSPIIINQVSHGGGFGWDDLLLYHLIFNRVSPYSSSNWGNNHRSYNYRSNTPYVTKTYEANSFSNRSATKTPTTSSKTGTFTTNKSSSSKTTGSSSGTSTGSSTGSSNGSGTGSTGGSNKSSVAGSSNGSSSGSGVSSSKGTGTSGSSGSTTSSSSSSSSSKSTSTSSGSIGGKSSGFSSSSSSGG